MPEQDVPEQDARESSVRDDHGRITRTLQLYASYRVLFALLFLTLLLNTRWRELFPPFHSALYATGAMTFATGTLLLIAHSLWRKFRIPQPALFIHLLVDLAAVGVITFAAGGLASGFALPMVITTACAAAVIREARLLLLVAASASLTLLIQESALALHRGDPNLFAAGLLGALLFVIALGIRQLSEYLRDAEQQQRVQAGETARLEKLNELIVQRMHTGLVVVDQRGVIALINRAAIDLLGGNRPQRPLAVRQTLNAIPELHRVYQQWRIYPWLRPPVFTAGGHEIQPSCASLEPGENRHTLIFLEDNSAHAQRAQQLKLGSLGKLTAGIAHEIRNPLGAVSHAAELLGEQCPPGSQTARLTEIILNHAGRINEIIENVLQLSRQRPAERSRFELRDWLREFATGFTDHPGARPVIAIEGEGDHAPLNVEFDSSQLRQVLTNLLDNALRYSEAQCGERWALLRTGTDPLSGRPWLEVRDRGPGVSSADRERLFEPFFTNSPQGTGLGLYISRELCEMNRATLECPVPEAMATGQELPGGACFRIGFAHPERHIEPPQR